MQSILDRNVLRCSPVDARAKGICKRELGDVERFATRDWLALAVCECGANVQVSAAFRSFVRSARRKVEKPQHKTEHNTNIQSMQLSLSLSLSLSSIVSALNLLYSLAYIFTQWQSWKEIKGKGKGA
jgi:hypothetical protein